MKLDLSPQDAWQTLDQLRHAQRRRTGRTGRRPRPGHRHLHDHRRAPRKNAVGHDSRPDHRPLRGLLPSGQGGQRLPCRRAL